MSGQHDSVNKKHRNLIAEKERTMKKVIAALLTSSILACSLGSTVVFAEEQEYAEVPAIPDKEIGEDGKYHLHFAWLVDNIDISQQGQYDIALAYADYLNSHRDDIEVEFTLMNAESSVEKQINNIETAMAMQVDAIILTCVDPIGVKASCMQAMEAGVPVVDWRDIGRVCTLTFNGGDEGVKGDFAYEWTKQYLEENPDLVINAGLQYGATTQTAQFARMEPIQKLEEEYPDRFHILVSQYSDWSSDTSQKMVEDWIQANPDMNFILTASDEQALGVVEALRGANKLDQVTVVTFDGNTTGLNMLKKGDIEADVGLVYSILIGSLVDYSIRCVLEKLTGYYDVSELTSYMVTPENVDEFTEMQVVDFENNMPYETTLKDSYID